MKNEQWEILCSMIKGQLPPEPLSAFIIDSPWLPGWGHLSTLEYYTNDVVWFEVNKKVVQLFPDIIFLPGFWSEYGMCTEPSAFGAKMIWAPDNLPHAEKIVRDIADIEKLLKPNVNTDGLLPFMINRLIKHRGKIESLGHEIKMAVSRGPLNIASFLMGTTEFMMALVTDRDAIIQFLKLITEFIIDWIRLQKKQLDSIEGILILDDLVGFIGEEDFKELAMPYLKEIFSAFPSRVNLFHNDAQGLISAPYMEKIGIDIFNFSFEHHLAEMQKLVGDSVILLGNIPPRDIMAQGSPHDVKKCLEKARAGIKDPRKILWSVGGGMPQGVSTDNIKAFVNTVSRF